MVCEGGLGSWSDSADTVGMQIICSTGVWWLHGRNQCRRWRTHAWGVCRARDGRDLGRMGRRASIDRVCRSGGSGVFVIKFLGENTVLVGDCT